MMRTICTAVAAVVLLPLSGCGDHKLPAVSSKLLDPDGGFTLYVSNQSFAINPVDVLIEIDGELVVSDYFRVGTQHTFVPFKLSLSKGKHWIRIWSKKGDSELSTEFDLNDHEVGVVTFWYYPKSHYNSTPRKFEFSTQKGPLMIM